MFAVKIMIFVRLEYLCKPHIFLCVIKTRFTDRQFCSFWKIRLTDRYFGDTNIQINNSCL
jgi:hypothetical protein